MVEQEAVNFEVTGSSPVRGAKILPLAKLEAIFLLGLLGFHDTIILMIGGLCGKVSKHDCGREWRVGDGSVCAG